MILLSIKPVRKFDNFKAAWLHSEKSIRKPYLTRTQHGKVTFRFPSVRVFPAFHLGVKHPLIIIRHRSASLQAQLN
jgi:hypothetical protein